MVRKSGASEKTAIECGAAVRRIGMVFAVVLVLSGCASSPVFLVNPASGEQVECPFPSGMTRRIAHSDAAKVAAAMADAGRNHLSPVDRCIKFYEALGFIRTPLGPAEKASGR